MGSGFTKEDADKIEIDQLHQLVLQLSKNCFEIKKLCATLLVSVSAFIAGFMRTQPGWALFIGAGAVIGCFYILDVQSYYYQRKVRAQMKEIAQAGLDRAGHPTRIQGVGMPLCGAAGSQGHRIVQAFFNASMLFYGFLAALDGLVTILWRIGWIETIARGSTP